MTAKPISEFYYRKEAGKHRRDCKECVIIRQRERDTGVKHKDYLAALERQGGVCGICGGPPLGNKNCNSFAADHDHETGRFRGLLCGKCNMGIGCFDDDPDRFRKATAWVEDIVSSPVEAGAATQAE